MLLRSEQFSSAERAASLLRPRLRCFAQFSIFDSAADHTVPCIFCEIAQARMNAPVVFEDAESIAFLDHRPIFAGHLLLIPRSHIETLPELPRTQNEPFLSNVQVLCRAVEAAMDAEGTFVAVNNKVSQSVPHLHVHIVPRRRGDGLRGFFWPRRRYNGEEELREVQDKVRHAVSRMAAR